MTIFSHDFKALEEKPDPSLADYDVVVAGMFAPLPTLWPAWAKVPTPRNLKLDKAFAAIEKILYGSIDRHSVQGHKPFDDILDKLVILNQQRVAKGDSEFMSRKQVCLSGFRLNYSQSFKS